MDCSSRNLIKYTFTDGFGTELLPVSEIYIYSCANTQGIETELGSYLKSSTNTSTTGDSDWCDPVAQSGAISRGLFFESKYKLQICARLPNRPQRTSGTSSAHLVSRGPPYTYVHLGTPAEGIQLKYVPSLGFQTSNRGATKQPDRARMQRAPINKVMG